MMSLTTLSFAGDWLHVEVRPNHDVHHCHHVNDPCRHQYHHVYHCHYRHHCSLPRQSGDLFGRGVYLLYLSNLFEVYIQMIDSHHHGRTFNITALHSVHPRLLNFFLDLHRLQWCTSTSLVGSSTMIIMMMELMIMIFEAIGREIDENDNLAF